MEKNGFLQRIKSIFGARSDAENTVKVGDDGAKLILKKGNDLEDQGSFDLALSTYEHLLTIHPQMARAHLNKGNVLMKMERFSEALSSYNAAIELDPSYAAAHYNKGNALAKLENTHEAIGAYNIAIGYNPVFFQALVAKGNALVDVDKPEEAIECYEQALKLNPQSTDIYRNLASVLLQLKKHDKFIEIINNAIKSNPDDANSFFSLGNLYLASGDIVNAQTAFRQIIKIPSVSVELLNAVGRELNSQGDYVNAKKSLLRALANDDSVADAHNNLGLAYLGLLQLDDALKSFKAAVFYSGNTPDYFVNIGNVHAARGDLDHAIESTKEALKINPEFYLAVNNLGSYYKDSGQIDNAVESFKKSVELNPEFNGAYSNYLFCLSHKTSVTTDELFNEHCLFGTQYEASLGDKKFEYDNTVDTERFLKIGFVSGDLFNHAVVSFFEPILASLAKKTKLHIYVYSNNPVEDNVTQRMKAYVRSWLKVANLSDDKLAEMIHADKIDILIDLSGHTALNRLLTFARKPAPIQASWIGYPGTTGLTSMDYYIGDRYFIPPEKVAQQFVEKLAIIPISITFQPQHDAPDVNALPALSNGHITFGSFNRIDKINREVIALWGKLLRAIPKSTMIFGGLPARESCQQLLKWLEEEGISEDRLTLYQRTNMRDYLTLHHKVDVCLDTFPYTGGTTTNHALWMGVPTLTMVGATISGRQGASNLSHVGLQSLFVAEGPDDFVSKGSAIALQLRELSEIRMGLRQRFLDSAFCQQGLVADSFECALRHMWKRWCDDLAPATFEVIKKDTQFDIKEFI
ncbi:tetratricopeptide repeat protein [Undibacterium sp. CY21W]|uniref:tetratricopeptide repeat protein n=1 Tax=Undibacterium sp. CY21W TaxID=2762293 RepID=UPI00164C69BE|nr:tetratricopeptide repeat protein [Undibacterium sp. CY21W]MBC3927434.1 tetratricopeptide repeat protein [Undibacterium sp. CY21W]